MLQTIQIFTITFPWQVWWAAVFPTISHTPVITLWCWPKLPIILHSILSLSVRMNLCACVCKYRRWTLDVEWHVYVCVCVEWVNVWALVCEWASMNLRICTHSHQPSAWRMEPMSIASVHSPFFDHSNWNPLVPSFWSWASLTGDDAIKLCRWKSRFSKRS